MADNATTNEPSELAKLRFDYAWKWFSFHADQRIKMFNYMLVVFGIFAAGVVNALDKHLPNPVVSGLCFSAGFLALIFTRLDARNQDLVWLGEDVLVELERETIFGADATIKGHKGDNKDKNISFGILLPQANAQTHWKIYDAWRGKHRVLLRWIGYLIAILFFASGIWILVQPPAIASKPRECLQCVQVPQAAPLPPSN